jgi:hypothetical protein
VKVVSYLNTFSMNIYLHFSVDYSESYDFCKFAIRSCQFENSVNTICFVQRFKIN